MIGNEPNGAVAVFATPGEVDAAIAALRASGVPRESISVIGPGGASQPPPELDHSPRHSLEVARFWGQWGAVVGAGVGAAVVAVPLIAAAVGLGPFAPLLLAIPVVTSGVGAMATALGGLGIHEAHALRYEHALRAGKFVLVVHTDDRDALEDARVALGALAPEALDVHGIRRRSAA